MMKNQLNIKLVFLICLTSLWHFPAVAQGSAGKCAVSIDMVLIGEVCILGGLGVRGGAYDQDFRFYNPGTRERTAKYNTLVPLLPIILATRPTEFYWMHFQFFIDFSLLGKTSADRVYIENMTGTMTDGQIAEFKKMGIIIDYSATTDSESAPYYIEMDPTWTVKADLSYQYITFGFMLKAPWPYFFKPFLGVGLSLETIDIDFNFYKNGTTVSFYKAYISNLELVRFTGIELLNFDEFFFDNDNLVLGKATAIRYDTITIEGTNGIKQEVLREKVIFEWVSWSFTF